MSEAVSDWSTCPDCGCSYANSYGHSKVTCLAYQDYRRLCAKYGSESRQAQSWRAMDAKRSERENPVLYCELCRKKLRALSHNHKVGATIVYSAPFLHEVPRWIRAVNLILRLAAK